MKVEILDIVQVTLDHPRVGAGRRLFIILQATNRKVRLFSCGNLRIITIPTKTFRAGLPIKAAGIEPVRLARRLDSTRKTFLRHGVVHPATAVRQIVACLRAEALALHTTSGGKAGGERPPGTARELADLGDINLRASR